MKKLNKKAVLNSVCFDHSVCGNMGAMGQYSFGSKRI